MKKMIFLSCLIILISCMAFADTPQRGMYEAEQICYVETDFGIVPQQIPSFELKLGFRNIVTVTMRDSFGNVLRSKKHKALVTKDENKNYYWFVEEIKYTFYYNPVRKQNILSYPSANGIVYVILDKKQ